MYKLSGNLLALFLFLSFGLLQAQQDCTYQLEMSDASGDGWNGGELTLTLDGVDTTYSLTDEMGNGSAFTELITVTDGAILRLGYTTGPFPEEVAFRLIDAECNVIYSYGPNSQLQADSIFQDTVVCPSCIAPNLCGDIDYTRLRATSVEISYSSVASNDGNPTTYLVEYGLAGYNPDVEGEGFSRTTTDTIFRVQPLTELTRYDIYVSTICGPDTSIRIGPLRIMTPYTNDLGITTMTDPISGCGLAAEEVRFGITNFGGVPQSFIRIGLSIDGEVVGINYPSDGLYTGVVGVDSTDFFSFDLTPNFGTPGEYEIKLWTELDGDQDLGNDTLTTYLYSAPTEGVYPYFQDFEEGDDFWMDQERDPAISSWEFGTPDASIINAAASGNKAWVSNLNGVVQEGETSYLYSPCFDFSASDTDPVLSFDFINDLRGLETSLSLEATTDGVDYIKVGAFGEGLNWYNDALRNQWKEVFRTTPEWKLSAIKLEGFGGEPEVRFRFKLETNETFSAGEGVGIDNILITPQAENDMAAAAIDGPDQICGSVSDLPIITFFNMGSTEATNITLSYQANGGDVVTETFSGTVGSFEQATYTFTTAYDGSLRDTNEIVAWVSLTGDNIQQNDTVTTSIITRRYLPVYEDFESGERAIAEWQTSNVFVQNAHNAGSTVLYANLFQGTTSMLANSPNYGPLEAGDSIAFDYRFVNFSDDGATGTNLQEDDILSLDLIIDCDSIISDFVRISSANHTATTDFTHIAASLPDALAGKNIQLVFRGTANNSSNFYLDLDNINIKRCPGSLSIITSITNTADSIDMGSITLSPRAGFAPYTYSWSNGANTATVNNLGIGEYMVTVTDAQGCEEVNTYNVISSLEEVAAPLFKHLSVFPNPTTNAINLKLELTDARNLQLQLFNQFGQGVISKNLGRQLNLNETIDMNRLPAGIYFLRLSSAGEQQTVRVIKTR